jgi:hypothetical protein
MTHQDDGAFLEINVAEDQLPRLFPLLGGGFGLRTDVDLTVSNWFGRQPGLSTDYLQNRVQTIFLDGRAVDDADRAVVRDGSTLALSAAMPGLVGATFRKGGRYAAMRSAISYDQEGEKTGAGTGFLTVKLFNMVAAEIGPLFLERGIRVQGRDLAAFLSRLPDAFRQGCGAVRLDGRPVAFSDLGSSIGGTPHVWLKATCSS